MNWRRSGSVSSVSTMSMTRSTSEGWRLRWAHDLTAGDGQIQVSAGWGDNGPTVVVALADLEPADAPLTLAARIQVDDTGVDVGCSVGLDLAAVGVTVVPRLVVDVVSGPPLSLRVRFLPLSSGSTPPVFP